MTNSRNLQFAAFSFVTLMIFRASLQELISFSLSSELFAYILGIPFVSLYFTYVRKEKIFSNVRYSILAGTLIIIAGLALYLIGKQWKPELTPHDYLSVMTGFALLTWIGGFIFFYGIRTFHAGLFPLCFLFFMVPIPELVLEQLILFLQKVSTEAVAVVFKITGVPVQQDGFVFSLSSLQFVVAKECSGIRSSLYLFMTSLVFGQLFLKTPVRRAILTLSVLPLTIFKNSLRIVTLTLLGNYVNEAILLSTLHRRGGIPFMIIAVILLAFVVRWLRHTEEHASPWRKLRIFRPLLLLGKRR